MVEKIVIEKSEFLLLLLSMGILIFLAGNASKFRQIQHSKTLIISFLIFFVGWVVTVLEGFFWESILNPIEHICYIVGAVFLAIWCRKILCKFPNANRFKPASKQPERETKNKEPQ